MLIPFPAFESNLEYLLDGARELRANRAYSARTLFSGLHQQLARVRGSSRHDSLAEFVSYAADACERGDSEGALNVILMALCYFETMRGVAVVSELRTYNQPKEIGVSCPMRLRQPSGAVTVTWRTVPVIL